MIKNQKNLLKAVLIFFLLGLSTDVENGIGLDSKTFLWKVRSKTNTVYLLGSIHLFKKDLYPLNARIEEAFAQSDLLAVEANISDPRQLDLQKLVEKALYSGDDTVENHVSRQTYELIRKRGGELGLPTELLMKQKPWFLGLMLTSVGFLKLGFDPTHGIDQYFLSKAAGKKSILELESLEYQFNLLSNFSDRDQELFLLMALRDLDAFGKDMDRFLQAWVSGDTRAIERMMTQSMTEDNRLSSIYEALVYDRNRKMASRVEDFLKARETYFVIVGAGHLIGEKGIVEILRKKGYLVEHM